MKRGPKPDIKKDKRALGLKNRGLSYREIAKVMEISVPTAYFRVKRALVSYPQAKT